jgi:hypothetical protein
VARRWERSGSSERRQTDSPCPLRARYPKRGQLVIQALGARPFGRRPWRARAARFDRA